MPAIVEVPKPKSEQRHTSKRPESLVVRCMVYPDHGEYAAECIDLDIMARGATPHEVFQSLHDAMRGYIKTVLKGDFEGLVPRPAPMSHRLHYHWLVLRTVVTIGIRRKFFVADYPL